MDAAENSQNLPARSSAAHAHLLEQLMLAYSFRVIISDKYGSVRDFVQLSSLREISRDIFGCLVIFTCWRALDLFIAGWVKISCLVLQSSQTLHYPSLFRVQLLLVL